MATDMARTRDSASLGYDANELGRMTVSLLENNRAGNNSGCKNGCNPDYRTLQALVGAAVNQDCLSGYVRRPLRCQPDHGIGKLARFTNTPERRVHRPTAENLSFALTRRCRARLGQLLQPVGSGVTRPYVVHQNAVFAELVGQALDQPYDRSSHCVR